MKPAFVVTSLGGILLFAFLFGPGLCQAVRWAAHDWRDMACSARYENYHAWRRCMGDWA